MVADADTAGNIVCDPGRNMNIGGVVNNIDRDEMVCGINPNHIVSDVDTAEVGSDVMDSVDAVGDQVSEVVWDAVTGCNIVCDPGRDIDIGDVTFVSDGVVADHDYSISTGSVSQSAQGEKCASDAKFPKISECVVGQRGQPRL